MSLGELKAYTKIIGSSIYRGKGFNGWMVVRIQKGEALKDQWRRTRKILKNIGFEYVPSFGWCARHYNKKWLSPFR
jgi:hypothetical protein